MRDYLQARNSFLSSVEKFGMRNSLGVELAGARHPSSLGKTELHCDIALCTRSLSPTSALVVISGTHGLEGPAGHRFQIALCENQIIDRVAQDVMVVLVHALNPWGWLHGRRVDHSNVDVNRSAGPDFITRCDYETIHPLLCPDKMNDEAITRIRQDMASENKRRALQAAATGGQYDFLSGLFYGGTELSWSAKVLKNLCEKNLSRYRRIAVMDIHTGLGENAKGDIYSVATAVDDPLFARTRQVFGEGVQFPLIGGHSSSSSPISGNILSAMLRWLPQCEVLPVAVEMGTPTDLPSGLLHLVKENYWYHKTLTRESDDAADALRNARAALWNMFDPVNTFWRGACYSRCRNVFEALERYLSE